MVIGLEQLIPRSGTELPTWNLIMAAAMMALLPPVAVIVVHAALVREGPGGEREVRGAPAPGTGPRRLSAVLGTVTAAAPDMIAPLFAAHRGGAALWPENSLLAFRNALALGADYLELDVHLTRDGEVMVIHDATLERTTTGSGPVRERTAAELGALRLKDRSGAVTAEPVPTLDEVVALAAAGKRQMLLEIKTDERRRRYPGHRGEGVRRPRPPPVHALRDRDGVRGARPGGGCASSARTRAWARSTRRGCCPRTGDRAGARVAPPGRRRLRRPRAARW